MAVKFTIKLDTKPIWKVSRGHSDYRGGTGKHDNRPRKLRTKSAQKNQAINGGTKQIKSYYESKHTPRAGLFKS